MRVYGIAAEYNPFHGGHARHIDMTRAAGASHIVAVMSGSFVQRGEPAVISKFLRAGMAAACGVDLVVELPVQYAVASSERFAAAAVALLDSLGCVCGMSFGSESGDMPALSRAAMAVEDPGVIERTRQLYHEGYCYPSARQMAVGERFGEETAGLLRGPNNILAVDYIRAIRARGAAIEPCTVRRDGAPHDGEPRGSLASAGFLRRRLAEGEDISPYLPGEASGMLEAARERGDIGGGMEAIEKAVLYKLRSLDRERFGHLPDCADGLGDRILKAASLAGSLGELYAAAKTRRYTMSRVRRAVACALLDIDDSFCFPPPYARILAIGGRGRELLGAMKRTAAIPFSAGFKALAALGGEARKTALAEQRATDVFGLTLRRAAPKGRDYTQKLYVEARR